MQSRWQGELARSVRSLDELKRTFPRLRITKPMREAELSFPMAITPHCLGLIRKPSFSDPVFAQFVPSGGELAAPEWLTLDPLGERRCEVAPGLVHRYPDRALLLVSTACASYCRHCTRKRVSGCTDRVAAPSDMPRILDYLSKHPEICDVLVSGGDPLMLTDSALGRILDALATVPSVRVVRLCTRLPMSLPSRVSPALVRALAPRRRPFAIYANTQFNHPNELSEESFAACARLTDAGIPVASQTVLLRVINDDAATLEKLFRELYCNRIRPYALYQCDLVRGIEHFRTPVETGIRIMRELRARLSGPALPHFIIDPPGLAGKIELSPDPFVRRKRGCTVLRASNGKLFEYPEPEKVQSSGFRVQSQRRMQNEK